MGRKQLRKSIRKSVGRYRERVIPLTPAPVASEKAVAGQWTRHSAANTSSNWRKENVKKMRFPRPPFRGDLQTSRDPPLGRRKRRSAGFGPNRNRCVQIQRNPAAPASPSSQRGHQPGREQGGQPGSQLGRRPRSAAQSSPASPSPAASAASRAASSSSSSSSSSARPVRTADTELINQGPFFIS